jgi:hypothetical protein
MAKARMLHNKISRSLQVNRLSLEAQLLFTWLISHADDEGRLYGEPEYIKGTVVPLKEDWTSKDVARYLDEIKEQGLIYSWQDIDRTAIQLVKWGEHQQIRTDRFKPSLVPSYPGNDNHKTTKRQPSVNQTTTQVNITEDSKKEIEKSETNSEFKPNNNDEYSALFAWKSLEPENKSALHTTYLNAVRKGIKANTIFRFVSEIKQDHTIKNPGRVFNKKVEDYILKEDDKS